MAGGFTVYKNIIFY